MFRVFDTQDFWYVEYEMICVNDGPTNKSFNILKEYPQNNENTYVIDKENGGVADSRNGGLEGNMIGLWI